MNTSQRLFLLQKFTSHIDQKLVKIQTQKQQHLQTIQNYQIDFSSLPKISILQDLSSFHNDINSTIKDTYDDLATVMDELRCLKNRKQNTAKLQDSLASISMIKNYSITLKADNFSNDLGQLYKALDNYYQIRDKAKYCDNYIKQIDQEVNLIEAQCRKQFDAQLTKTDSECIKQLSRILQLIKTSRKHIAHSQKSHQQQLQRSSIHSTQSLSQIAQFYVSMVKKELAKYEEQLFAIPIVSSNLNEQSYVFFDIIKNVLKAIATIVETYQSNIIKLEGLEGLHTVIVEVFKYVMQGVVYEVLVRGKKYFEIDKIIITREKLAIKSSQYKILKNYFKEFNAIWNQIQRFKTHLSSYIQQTQYENKTSFFNQLNDILNSSKLIEFNFEIILYFQAFFRHQLDRLLKKNPFILSLWQLQDQFFKEVRQKNQYKSNLMGQDFLEEMIVKFAQGIKKSFETLNVLIVSALINFVNHHLIYEDSFYAFNELLNRFLTKLSDPKAIQGIVILLNTVTSYPKAIKSAFTQLQIPEELPSQRITNELQQLIISCKQKTSQFILEGIQKILISEPIQFKLQAPLQSLSYQQVVNKMFTNFQKQLLELFVYKMSKVHVQIILRQEFRQKYSQMEVLALEKDVRAVINFYQTKSHSIRQNFRQVLDYIQILLIENESALQKLIQQWKDKYTQTEIRNIWKLVSGN